ncbi:DUF4383 domain-containing protein [Actinomycetospora straminea]|uniref:DUF4383 domain-containing protein n=1 Tax=Actinomycetospora straminea TaxID=663607 RepID=A0ABP9F0W8_9PSEU|nr:DUF4383 domain-containing protein [Actinomycetospora straminea]MDD7935798.1 DUF4383 domain-containing protein [Actinomycetospora straminea]
MSLTRPPHSPDPGVTGPAGPEPPTPLSRRVVLVHRAGALTVAAVIAVFGVLGYVGGLSAFDTRGMPLLGLSTNGLLSTVSVVTAAILVLAAVRGGRPASTVMIVIGVAFLLAAFAGLAVLATPYNLLAFRLPNVFFSIGAGLVLLVVGSYGRVVVHLPPDNPYGASGDRLVTAVQSRFVSESTLASLPEDHQPRPRNAAELRADRELADAYRAQATGVANADTLRRLAALERCTTHEERRSAWLAQQDGHRR